MKMMVNKILKKYHSQQYKRNKKQNNKKEWNGASGVKQFSKILTISVHNAVAGLFVGKGLMVINSGKINTRRPLMLPVFWMA